MNTIQTIRRLSLLTVLLWASVASAYYDPQVQRWINRDPLGESGFEVIRNGRPLVRGDGPNLFCFVSNNPVNSLDWFGTAAWTFTYRCPLQLGPYACSVTGPISWPDAVANAPQLLKCLAVAMGVMNAGCCTHSERLFQLGCLDMAICLKKYASRTAPRERIDPGSWALPLGQRPHAWGPA